ncbi:MAG TPA: hypothetical protein VMG41_16195 [Gemmatimonadales bacterium]|nr:hypothetical protein [Gemmatimonadales bacterium]
MNSALCRSLSLVLLAGVARPSAAYAQTGSCPSDTTASARVCQAGIDLLNAFLPVEGILAGGGNPVPGTAGAVGRFGHFRVATRVGLVGLSVPNAGYDGSSDTVHADKRLLVPMPRLDLSMGVLTKKLPMGSAAVDLLGSAVLLPASATSRVRVDPDARSIGGVALGLGYGFRGAFTLAGAGPTISLSVMKRDMPSIRFGDLSAGDRFSAATTLSAISARLMVGGRSGLLSLSAGGGMDLYKGTGTVSYADSSGADSTVAVSLSTSRILAVLNVALNLGPLSLWTDGGFQVGKKTTMTTVFQGTDPSAGRFFGGLGAALTF